MNFLKKYKNFIILILIISGILFSTKIVEFGSGAIKKIEKMFTSSKTDYSNLSSQGYKIKSTSSSSATRPSSPSSSSSSKSSSKNEGARSMFKNTKKEPTPEELDKQIMGDQEQQNNPADLRGQKGNRQFNNAVNEQKMSSEKFDMDMKKEFDTF
jgi:hypothetical protein